MRREHNWGAGIRDFVQFFDEDGALGFEALHHIAVMDDFMAHIDGRAVFGERKLDDLDRAVHAGAKTAGRGQIDGERRTVGAPPIGLVGTGHRRLGRCVSMTLVGLSLALSRFPAGSSLRAKVEDRQPAIYLRHLPDRAAYQAGEPGMSSEGRGQVRRTDARSWLTKCALIGLIACPAFVSGCSVPRFSNPFGSSEDGAPPQTSMLETAK